LLCASVQLGVFDLPVELNELTRYASDVGAFAGPVVMGASRSAGSGRHHWSSTDHEVMLTVLHRMLESVVPRLEHRRPHRDSLGEFDITVLTERQ
jgi:hypothetical protein